MKKMDLEHFDVNKITHVVRESEIIEFDLEMLNGGSNDLFERRVRLVERGRRPRRPFIRYEYENDAVEYPLVMEGESPEDIKSMFDRKLRERKCRRLQTQIEHLEKRLAEKKSQLKKLKNNK